jgi:sulfite reductase alpha subunit-like flavoprotein
MRHRYLTNAAVITFTAALRMQGDPPDNMRRFWRLLLRKNLPGDLLAGLHYAVFGLGDSGYVKYNVSRDSSCFQHSRSWNILF